MNLRHLTDSALVRATDSIARQEREILTQLLYHLHEINFRRLFSALGYKSLFEYCVKKLGYPEDQAYRRINAMKLLQRFDKDEKGHVEKKINEGAISLSHLSLLEGFCKKNSLNDKDRMQLFRQISNTTVREAEKEIFAFAAANSLNAEMLTASRESIRPTPDGRIEIRLVAEAKLEEKISKLKGLIAHKYPKITLGELMSLICDLAIEEWDPGQVQPKRKYTLNQKAQKIATPKKHRIKTSSAIRRQVWQRDKSSCTQCGSKYALQIDHIIPKAFGGSDTAENLRLLCRSCNQRAAIEKLGLEKAAQFFV